MLPSIIYTAAALVATVVAAPVKSVGCGCTDIAHFTFPVDQSNSSNIFAAGNIPPTNKLYVAAIGVGTQNYTCVNGVPTQVGAVATLYDASCILASNQDFFNEFPNLAVQTSPELQNSVIKAMAQMAKQQYTIGYHYFRDSTTPTFNLGSKGILFGNVTTKLPAPVYSSKGLAPTNYGAVPWLRVLPKTGTTKGIAAAFRVNTAGGNPPPTCTGDEKIEIPYSAGYLFFL